MVTRNGTWVTMMAKTSAGSSGARRTQRSLAPPLTGTGGGVLVCSSARVMTSVISGLPGRCGGAVGTAPPRALLVVLRHCLGELLSVVQCLVDRLAAGEGGAELLRELGTEVRELRDADELHTQRGPGLQAGVGRVGVLDRAEGDVREGLRRLL